ncbi:pre-rRNA-processing protein esf1 [Taxawa tesnikishii (nom. ined.)]|nr:pre-rRNA-processing protein esf1 [Dothideales sp. JES 119]
MATQGKPKPSRRAESGAAAQDPRFASIATDPRFRLPSSKNARVSIDKRFSRMLRDEDFTKKASVDRYGRKVKKDGARKDLQRLYKMDDEDQEDEDHDEEEERKVKKGSKKQIEIASASEDEGDEEDDKQAVDESGASDNEVEAELRRLEGKRDPAREGFSSSSSEESSSEEESDEEEEAAVDFSEEEQADAVPMGEVSSRLAAVNLDWDNIRATDLMAVASSFAPGNGRVLKVTVYPSEFGRERIEREEQEGPPRDIFASSKRGEEDEPLEDEDSEDEDERIKKQLLKEDTGEEFDSARLRQYQLDRLKYYYAVILCDSNSTAKALYDAMDGREYLTTANFFDLRFIPDEVSFDGDKLRDECTQLPAGYKPNEFVTEALTHSKVRLTWDDDDTTRKEIQKRAFSRAEMDENDLQAYIGSDTSDDEEDENPKADKAAQMRAALGLSAALTKTKGKKDEDGPVGDMQVTFTSGLSGSKKDGGVFENSVRDVEETTRERYIRKEKERKARRKEKAKAARDGVATTSDAEGDADEDVAATDEEEAEAEAEAEAADGFNDPFFDDPAAARQQEKAARKAARAAKRTAREAEEKAREAERAQLELLMVDDKESNMRHFNMDEIAKAEKQKNRKGKKAKAKGAKDGAEAAEQQQGDGFEMETSDPRFAALFESHEYAIDPTNPRFKGTAGMKALLQEGRKKRKAPPRARTSRSGRRPRVERGGRRRRRGRVLVRGIKTCRACSRA